jgi:hypothetical protein
MMRMMRISLGSQFSIKNCRAGTARRFMPQVVLVVLVPKLYLGTQIAAQTLLGHLMR